jgi:hypothetical protein
MVMFPDFNAYRIELALCEAKGDVEAAIECLLNPPKKCARTSKQETDEEEGRNFALGILFYFIFLLFIILFLLILFLLILFLLILYLLILFLFILFYILFYFCLFYFCLFYFCLFF